MHGRDETAAAELEAWRSRRSRIEQRLVELQGSVSLSEEERVERQWLEKEHVEVERIIARLCKLVR